MAVAGCRIGRGAPAYAPGGYCSTAIRGYVPPARGTVPGNGGYRRCGYGGEYGRGGKAEVFSIGWPYTVCRICPDVILRAGV